MPAAAQFPRRARSPVRAALRVWRSPRASLITLTAGLTAYLVSRLLPLLPLHDELTYGSGIGDALSRFISIVTGMVPFSIAEVFIFAYVLWMIRIVPDAIRSLVERRRSATHLFSRGALRAARHAGAYLALFYLLWGMNYARPPLAAQAAWRAGSIDVVEMLRLAESATRATNEAYVTLHGTTDMREPTQLPTDIRVLDAALNDAWREAATLLPLPRAAAREFGPVKRPLLSPVIAQLDIAGIYVPFTGEANVVAGLPALRTPMSMAHEKAHQRGIARESDANFVAFIVASRAADPLSRYAASYFAMQQLYNQLTWFMPEPGLRDLVTMRLPGVRRDIRNLYEWYRQSDGFASAMGGGWNSVFLNLNGIEGGTADYGRSVFLLVEWARQHDGELFPPPHASVVIPTL